MYFLTVSCLQEVKSPQCLFMEREKQITKTEQRVFKLFIPKTEQRVFKLFITNTEQRVFKLF